MPRALLINSYGQYGKFTLSNVKKSVCFSGKLWTVQILEGTFRLFHFDSTEAILQLCKY